MGEVPTVLRATATAAKSYVVDDFGTMPTTNVTLLAGSKPPAAQALEPNAPLVARLGGISPVALNGVAFADPAPVKLNERVLASGDVDSPHPARTSAETAITALIFKETPGKGGYWSSYINGAVLNPSIGFRA